MHYEPGKPRFDFAGRPLPEIRKRPPLIVTPEIEARFWKRVDKAPGQGPSGDCWCWTGSLTDGGYPSGMPIKLEGESFTFRVGQVALAIDGRPQPSRDMGALHSCDHPPCVRPAHLRWGTDLDNLKDAIARRKHGRTFTPDEIRDIRNSTDRQADIARRYSTSSSCISNIRKRVTHKHVE